MRHKSNNKTRPLFTLSLEMTRLVNETRLLLVPCFNSDIYRRLARGVQQACTMTTQNSKIRLISSIALKSRLIT